MVHLGTAYLDCVWHNLKNQLIFYYLAYFYYYSWVPQHFLVLFMDPFVLFQLTFYLYLQYF